MAVITQQAFERYQRIAEAAPDQETQAQAKQGLEIISQLVGVMGQAVPVVGAVPSGEMESFREKARPWAERLVGAVDQHSKDLEEQMQSYLVNPSALRKPVNGTGSWYNPFTWFTPSEAQVSDLASTLALYGGVGIFGYAMLKVLTKKGGKK
jgi:hypothetical protein